MGVSVTKRIDQVTQPRGGYIPPKDMQVVALHSDKGLDDENIAPSLVGLAVDYLTRFMLTDDAQEAFAISLLGAMLIREAKKAEALVNTIKGLDAESISSACKLVGYDVCFRAGPMRYKPVEEILPDESTIANIKEMVERSLRFFDQYGPIVLEGFTFEGGYTKIVSSGDGDFLTRDTLWDFKVSKKPPTCKHTLQLLMYYLMGKHSIHSEFDSIRYLAIYNPKLNTVYKYDLKNLQSAYVQEVEHTVIEY